MRSKAANTVDLYLAVSKVATMLEPLSMVLIVNSEKSADTCDMDTYEVALECSKWTEFWVNTGVASLVAPWVRDDEVQ